jgi:hypothetical protein
MFQELPVKDGRYTIKDRSPMNKRNIAYTGQWFWLAPLGLSLIGFGMSITGQAIAAKSQQKSFWRWFAQGTLGLCVLNSGIAVFGEAVKRKTLHDLADTDA